MNVPSSISRRLLALLAVAGVVALGACSKVDGNPLQPIEISRSTACSLDGMILADFPGPKAQILYEQGDPDFFCDTVEMFSIYQRPEQVRKIRAVYVQDMSKTDWKEPHGNWVDARTAFYVVGSKLNGSMGPTIGSFSSEAAASAFAAKEGGKVYSFDKVTPDMASLDGGVLKDHKM